MERPSSTGADISLASLESDKRKVDFATVQDDNELTSKMSPGTSRLQDKQGLRRAHTVAQTGNVSHKNNPSTRGARARTSSLRRVKDSSEVLRERSLKRLNQEKATSEGTGAIGGRQGIQFTVGNVGHNGKIYLRPLMHPNSTSSQPSTFVQPPQTFNEGYLRPAAPAENDHRYSIWSSSQLSELRPSIIREDSAESRSSELKYLHSAGTNDYRRYSLSTIDDHFPSNNRNELRIVIERPEPERPKSAGAPPVPSLEVPIPHFRLGGFRFTAEGTPMLRSSAYTRTSVSDNFRASAFAIKSDFSMPMSSQAYEVIDPSRLHSFPPSMFTGSQAWTDLQSPAKQNSVFYKLKEPVDPRIFDSLTTLKDDPSVVRYAKGTNEISAATPARIVAQISSDSFMDYELVSDFFLTFRSYLSLSNLMSLLLARLEWAINRPEDDGRIVRIRVFAALRHWILNYFVDDFVVNRALRVQFCSRINEMYEDVKNRSNDSSSDLKILQDLKKCWNGRCSLYWDSPDLVSDSPDAKVVPGGVAGSRDIELNRLSDARSWDTGIDAQTNITTTIPIYGQPVSEPVERLSRSYSHSRQLSTASAGDVPICASSVRSLQAISCSLPAKRRSLHSGMARGPHPVMVSSRRHHSPASSRNLATAPVIPIWRRPHHSHKRSGSFSDSVRDDRAPLPQSNTEGSGGPLFQALPYAESLIRGNVFPPVEPYVNFLPPPSPAFELSQLEFESRSSVKQDAHKSAGPGMKTLIGSIKRAFHPRQSSSVSHSHKEILPSLKGKTSTLPANVGFRSDAYRDKRSGPNTFTRVDVLCEEAAQSYRKLVVQETEKGSVVVEEETTPRAKGKQPASADAASSEAFLDPGMFSGRIPSHMTMGSKSIVIVDDTGFEIPLMSGALRLDLNSSPLPQDATGPSDIPTQQASTLVARSESPTPIYHEDRMPRSPSLALSEVNPELQERRSASVARSVSKRTVKSLSTRLRKYASYQSFSLSLARSSLSTVDHSLASAQPSQDSSDRPFGRMLRRRPGGDLRKVTNIHDLEPSPRPRSFASRTTQTDSMVESVISAARNRFSTYDSRGVGNREVPTGGRYSLAPPRPSQLGRHSFEAAVAEFSQIPDDDDGGIESTLLKLEGKWEKPSPASSPNKPAFPADLPAPAADSQDDGEETDKEKVHRHQHLLDPSVPVANQSNAAKNLSVISAPYTESVVESEDSYCSIPLLERGLSDDSMKSPQRSPTYPSAMTPSPLFNSQDVSAMDKQESSHPSIDIVEKTESLKRIPQGSTLPMPPTRHSLSEQDTVNQSDEYDSELSSEISVDVINRDEVVDKPEGDVHVGRSMSFSNLGILNNPLTHPPSPPMTLQHPNSMVSSLGATDSKTYHQRKPITPETSPIHKVVSDANRNPDVQQFSSNILLKSESQGRDDLPAIFGHVPFILACDSQVLAQQFTIVEKAALSEVDWKDLVDMRWGHTSQSTLNWADYLSKDDHKGIDMVIARFNLMVKWATSEIVLTRNINERAQTIVKFIHVALHARRILNYSTMLQITIALSSVDCTRLVKTWELVPNLEKQLLKDMESLIQPIRNFHKLRREMETTNLQDGCIPFVGLYVQDLTYNAQKPAQIATTRDGEPLVNFERYRTAATIVKSLLRLIDASTKYTFESVDGIIERCLWVAALPDEKITSLSKTIE
ncbi:hypothetical protein AJ80_08118 [Polytolypa hystricis UAMH7299]|uniref:Guanine nucleotide exchange factor LTE1 n=1 Tax=Polytolypa hystricis (strain UAMH7299) TaxID=1447883 RepID=A0A2B7XD58_POLH7|nr:hypothetical protein AJ80_08118 [Polytolypa hystricis UAMH7299]